MSACGKAGEEGGGGTKCKPRFKGIENFLRRIAFNLGNSPSQTEVKIISCIPIDVTDLQHKILELEKELECAKRDQEGGADQPASPRGDKIRVQRAAVSKGNPKKASVVNTALGAPVPRFQEPPHAELPSHSAGSSYCRLKPRASLALISTGKPTEVVTTSCVCPHKHHDHDHECPASHSQCDNHKGIFKLGRKFSKKKVKPKCKTHLVYYAQTPNSPFSEYTKSVASNKLPPNVSASRSYLADVIRRQYKPDRIVSELSESHFSSPVCRDTEQLDDEPGACESDIYSCCQGQFHNIDKKVSGPTHDMFFNNFSAHAMNDNSVYYDSSMYDVVPVKEQPIELKDEEVTYTRPEPELQLECQIFPEKYRDRVKSRYQPYVVNYHHTSPIRVKTRPVHKRTLPVKTSYRRENIGKTPKRRLDQQARLESSDVCSVECGDVYMRPYYPRHAAPKPVAPPVKPVIQKNAECLTISVNNTECQTASSKSVQLEPPPPEENKTEMTLNQIKSILQSVLTEVKTSSKLKSAAESTKDAVVQKGVSQSNMQACSSLLNSFTYSPYNINPYVSSYSRQTTQPVYPTSPCAPNKCLQNYPLFIQTTGRQCACCFRNMPGAPRSSYTRNAATTATNTESAQEPRNKETEKLIKEIYKSIAINMDFPTKDTSTSEYEDLKSPHNSGKKFEFRYEPAKKFSSLSKESKRKETKAEETEEIRKKAMRDTSTAPLYSKSVFDRNFVSNSASTRSGATQSTLEEQSPKVKSLLERKELPQTTESERDDGPYVVDLPNATPPSDDESSDSETDSDETIVDAAPPAKVVTYQKKKEKAGLFSKMAQLFKSKPKKPPPKEESESEEEAEEASDSDDYQTVYSEHVERRPKHVTYQDQQRMRRKPHSKVSYSRYYMHHRDRNERGRRSPYMEQELRRQWNERLAFHEGEQRYSSERHTRETDPRRRPVFYQDYEARPAYVHTEQAPLEPDKAPRAPDHAPRAPDHAPRSPDHVPQHPNVNDHENAKIAQRLQSSPKGIAWLKKHKLMPTCGEQWKKFILEG